MAAKNITANVTAENRPTVTERAVGGAAGVGVGARPSGAAGNVWDALTANPGVTVAAIVAGSGTSKATVARVLANLEGEGRAVRTRGGRDGGKRIPDTWTAVTPDTTDTDTDAPAATATDEPDTAPAAPATDVPAEEVPAAPAEPDEDATDTTDTRTDTTDTRTDTTDTRTDTATGAGDAGMDAAAVAEARDALTALGAAVAAALEALDAGDGEGAMSAADGAYTGSGLVRRLVRLAAVGRPRTGSGQVRSAPGEMRAKVAGHLTAHPGAVFTPHEVAKVIGHSAGAVSNALDRLAESGEAELVCERPRRFTAAAR